MAERIIQTIKDIADAIREKTGSTEKIKGEDIPQAIRDIEASLGDMGVYYNSIDRDYTGNVAAFPEITIFSKTGEMPSNIQFKNTSIVRLDGVKKLPNYFGSGSSAQEDKRIIYPLKKLYLDDNVEKFGTYTFGSSDITELIYPDGTTNRIPKKVKIIPARCFYNCKKIQNLKLHDDIEEIGGYAFTQLDTRIADTELPSKLKTIGNNAFSFVSIPITKMPSGVTTIGDNAFQSNSVLTSLTFEGVPSSISSLAFKSCTNLTTINVPWAQGAVANAPWGATNATINYNYNGG